MAGKILYIIERPNTRWVLVEFFSVKVKVVFDRQPLLSTGPDRLRNLAQSLAMVALDT